MEKTRRQDVHVHGCLGPWDVFRANFPQIMLLSELRCSISFVSFKEIDFAKKTPDDLDLYVTVVSLFCPYASRVMKGIARHGLLAVTTSAIADVPSISHQLIFTPRV